MTKFEKPVLSMDSTGIHIIDETVAEKLEKKAISPSMITSLNTCPAKWVAESFVIKDLIEEEPDNPARRGSLFHKIMEDVFAYPPEERTKELVRSKVQENLSEGEFADLGEIPEAVEWVRGAVNGYYSMGGDPTKVKVANITLPGEDEKLGLEIFVKGKIGDTKRETLGFIDRLVEDPEKPGSIIVEDWKTGAKAQKWVKKNKGDQGLAEQRQQIIYALLLKQDDIDVSKARLIYPVAKEIVNVDLDDVELRARVVKDVEETDKKLDVFIDNNTFEMTPSFLCSWCPLAKACAVADIKPYAKMQEAYAKQPSPDVLAEAIEFR